MNKIKNKNRGTGKRMRRKEEGKRWRVKRGRRTRIFLFGKK